MPFFLHRLAGAEPTTAGFDSGTLTAGLTFAHVFPDEGTFEYFCRFHPMQGIIRVTAGGPAAASVSIKDGPGRYDLNDVTIRPGGVVTWTHQGAEPHTVTQAAEAGLESLCINGRSFIGNTPTIRARAGRRIRWYVFNLDLGMMWHNFHVHSQRFRVGDEVMDTRSIGPAESFIADTLVPPVVLVDPTLLTSFRAALLLGLRQVLGGDPDHLDVVTAVDPAPGSVEPPRPSGCPSSAQR